MLPADSISTRHLTPLDPAETVFRLPKRTSLHGEGRLLPNQIAGFFELSTSDKEQNPPRCSLWAERLTSVPQALDFLPDPTCPRWVVRFAVSIITDATWSFPDIARPQIVWDEEVERRPGWSGHAGILNLLQDGSRTRRMIRTWIADLLNTCQPFSTFPDTH